MYQKLARNFDMIQYLIKNASPVQLSWHEQESGWSLGEVMGHLCSVEKRHARFNLPDTARRQCGSPAESRPGSSDKSQISPQILAEYAGYRRETLARLQHLTPAEWKQQLATVGRTGVMSLAEFVEKIDAHDKLHLRQMEQIIQRMPLNPLLARAIGEISEYHRIYQQYLAGQTSLLDIGVGPGLALHHVMTQNPHLACTGIDVRDLRLPGIQVPLQIYDGQALPFPADQFDISLLFYVLHHCQDAGRLLAEAVRVTRQKLIIIEEFTCPNVDPVSLELTERQSHRALGIPADLPYQLFNQAELAAMLRAHPLRLLEHQPLPSQTSRPVCKHLYVLAKEPR